MFRSTGQTFSLISFRLDNEAEAEGLLTINQLMNTVRLSADKKDKICLITNNVVIMVTKEDKKSLNGLISRVKGNLPSADPEYIQRVIPFISVLALKVDETVANAEDMISRLTLTTNQTQNQLFFN